MICISLPATHVSCVLYKNYCREKNFEKRKKKQKVLFVFEIIAMSAHVRAYMHARAEAPEVPEVKLER